MNQSTPIQMFEGEMTLKQAILRKTHVII